MERRYLVAALAIVATFAVFSHGFRSLEQLAMRHGERGAMAKAKCGASSAARAMANLRTHLRPGYAEEAQLLAEMNLPIAGLEAKAAGEMAKQNEAASACARETAMREAEHARRDANRMRENMAHAAADIRVAPMSLQADLPELDQRIEEKNAALAARIAAANVKLQIAAARLQDPAVWITPPAPPAMVVDVPEVPADVATHVQCKVKAVIHQHVQQAVRDAMRQLQYGYISK
jgi:hypothetical protein